MAKRGKKYTEAVKLIERSKAYSVTEAVELVKKTSTTKFDASVEVAFRLGVDPKKADQQIRGAVVLPNGTGKTQICHTLAVMATTSDPSCDFWRSRVRSSLMRSNCWTVLVAS